MAMSESNFELIKVFCLLCLTVQLEEFKKKIAKWSQQNAKNLCYRSCNGVFAELGPVATFAEYWKSPVGI